MFKLFQKETTMQKEADSSLHNKSTAGLIFATMLIMIVSESAVLIIIKLISILCGFEGDINALLLGVNISDFSQLLNLFLTLGSISGILIAARYYFRRSMRSLGLTKHRVVPQYLLGLVVGFVMMAASVGIVWMLQGFHFNGGKDFSTGILLLYLAAFIIQGFSEELLMRGFFMNAYASRKGMAKAILLNSFLFACLHLANDGISILAFINLILAGISFSLMAVYFDNIIVCSAAHTMWNFAQGNVFGVLVSGIYLPTTAFSFSNVAGKSWLNGGSFGLEGGLAVTIVELVCILVLCYLYKRKKDKDTTLS